MEAIIAMCKSTHFGSKICIPALTKQKKKIVGGGVKSINSNKQLVGRYNALHRILQEASHNIDQSALDQSLKFTVTGVQHALADVRTAAIQCMVEIYRTMGDKIMPSLSELRPAQMEQLESAFNQANLGTKAAFKPKKGKITEVVMNGVSSTGEHVKSKPIMIA